MSKKYILFTEEELDDLRDGRELSIHEENGNALYFMSKKRYDSLFLTKRFTDSVNCISEKDWKKAVDHLNMLIVEYSSIGFAGTFGLNMVLVPLKTRYDSGERSRELYDEIMSCE